MNADELSLFQKANRRVGHVAVSYKGYILVWGGFTELFGSQYYHSDELYVYDCYKEFWFRRLTKGQIPPPNSGASAVILNDTLYVFGGFSKGSLLGDLDGPANDLYYLNLTSMVWTQLRPHGVQPVRCDKLVGWEHCGKLYFFGGFGERPEGGAQFDWILDDLTGNGWNNQLVSYNPSSNCWEWPSVRGQSPSARAAHACDKSGPLVFISGGRLQNFRKKDLYILDMNAMTWSEDINAGLESVPVGRSWHSFTFITPDRAIMYGGLSTSNAVLNDCWVRELPTSSISSAKYGSSKWVEFDLRYDFGEPRCAHTATLALLSASGSKAQEEMLIVIVGGLTQPFYETAIKLNDHTDRMLILYTSPPSLLRLCLNAAFLYRRQTQILWKTIPHSLESILLKKVSELSTF